MRMTVNHIKTFRNGLILSKKIKASRVDFLVFIFYDNPLKGLISIRYYRFSKFFSQFLPYLLLKLLTVLVCASSMEMGTAFAFGFYKIQAKEVSA